MKKTSFLLLLFCLSHCVLATTAKHPAPVTQFDYEVLAERTHKPQLFTQGLVLDGAQFYESSGLYGQSVVVGYPVAEPETKWAKLIAPLSAKVNLPKQYFAEGLALMGNELYLLTWQEGTVFVYDKETMGQKRQLSYNGQGWGLTHNGDVLIRSDGSPNLYFHQPKDFALINTIKVIENQHPVYQLNELEMVEHKLWANIWHANRLIEIDPETGAVTGSLDLNSLVEKVKIKDSESVLNGIAYDPSKKAMWITGKNWPVMYLIRIIKPTD